MLRFLRGRRRGGGRRNFKNAAAILAVVSPYFARTLKVDFPEIMGG